MKKTIAATLLIGMVGCAVHETNWVNPKGKEGGFTGRKGVFYALPLTTADVDVVVTKVVLTPTKLGKALLALKDAPKTDTVETDASGTASPAKDPPKVGTTLRDGYLKTLGIALEVLKAKETVRYKVAKYDLAVGSMPDPNNVYFIEFHKGFSQDTSLNLSLTESGIPTKMTSDVKDRTLDQVGQVLQSLTGAVAAAAKFGGEPKAAESLISVIMGEVTGLENSRVRLLTSGTVSNVVALERQLAEIEMLRAKLIANFVEMKISTWTARYRVEPRAKRQAAGKETYELFQVNATDGIKIVRTDGLLAGAPKGWETKTSGEAVVLKVIRHQPSEHTFAYAVRHASGEVDRTEAQGFFYRVPEPASFVLSYKDQVRAMKTGMVAQFGIVAALPTEFNNTSSKLDAAIYAQSGALQSIGVETKAIEPETIARFGSALENVGQAYNSMQRASAAAQAAQAHGQIAQTNLALAIIQTALSVAGGG